MTDEERILDFLSDGQTWKIVELEYNLGISRRELIPLLMRLEHEGKLQTGGYRNSGSLKFVHIGPWRSEEDKRLYGCY